MTGKTMIGEMISGRKTTSIIKACKLVDVSRRTIYNWIASGKVEYVRTAGGSVRIFVDTLWREPEQSAAQQQAGDVVCRRTEAGRLMSSEIPYSRSNERRTTRG